MTDFDLETGETERLRHPARRVVTAASTFFALLFTGLVTAAYALGLETRTYSLGALGFATASVLILVFFSDLAIVTTDRLVVRRSWFAKNVRAVRFDAIEGIQQRGWRLIVSAGDRTVSFFCPPFLAPRIREAISAAKGVA